MDLIPMIGAGTLESCLVLKAPSAPVLRNSQWLLKNPRERM